MAPRLKPYAASDTDSEDKVFFWARLKLTGMYVLILTLILVGFSAFLYQSLGRNLSDADDNDFAGPDFHQHFVQNTLATVGQEIILIDVIILMAAAGVSYLLAGYTLRPIQRSLEAQRAFSENASHELRTPLAVMRNDMEVLLRNPSPSKEMVRAALRSGVEEVDRMTRMTEDLLLMARAQNHKILPAETVDLTAIVQSMLQKLRPLAEQKGVSVHMSGHPVPVRGEARSLERVVTNLLQNAIDHTPPQGSVEATIAQAGQTILLTISDTGSGIDEKDLPHIFKRFYKGSLASGSGLGLAIVRELVIQHKGEISLQSSKGEGTTVVVKLPAAA